MKQLLRSKITKYQNLIYPDSGIGSKQYWSEIIHQIQQTLDLEWTIFLEACLDGHTVKEVIALNCSIKDIAEKRRDYLRTPYRTAIDQGAPITVPHFLKKTLVTEVQYLVPLVFADEVLGFWALGIDQNKIPMVPIFMNVIKNFAAQVEMALCHRHQFQRMTPSKHRSVSAWIRKTFGLNWNVKLYNLLSFLERRVKLLEAVFRLKGDPRILYDPFGKFIQINPTMRKILEPLDIRPDQLTLLELLVQISGQERRKALKNLAQVIVERKRIVLASLLQSNRETPLAIMVTPILDEGGVTEPEDPRYNNFLGILLELSERKQ